MQSLPIGYPIKKTPPLDVAKVGSVTAKPVQVLELILCIGEELSTVQEALCTGQVGRSQSICVP